MSFFTAMLARVFNDLPYAVLFPWPIFLPVVAVLVMRRRGVERRLLGASPVSFWRELAADAIMGIAAGFLSSLLLLCLGITLYPGDFAYVLPAAIFLMLLDLRYLCLAYAGGLLALLALAIGQPKIHIPNLLALVAVLHVTESVLIAANGHGRALPAYFRHPRGTVGGYLLQRIWPMPLLYLTVMATAVPPEGAQYLRHPSWWPLIPIPADLTAGGVVFFTLPAAVILGYGDLALSATPRAKSLRTAGLLALYSLALLALAAAAAREGSLAWAAAVFAPCGHEAVLFLARRGEIRGRPLFTRRPDGVPILAVIPGTRAAEMGLGPGMLITSVNERPVRTKAEVLSHLTETNILTTIAAAPLKGGREKQYEFRGETARMGLILAPDPDEPAQVDVAPWRFLPGRRGRA